jgi:RNA recognition motif-containing protein
MEVKLYVGNLAYSTTEAELRRLFAQAGNVTSVNLIQDEANGQSKGFAFVTLGSQAEAQKAVAQFNAFFFAGRALKVTLAKLSAAPSGYQSQLSAFSLAGRGEPKANSPAPRAAQGGYQSRLSAFGAGSPPTAPRRPGRSRRH